MSKFEDIRRLCRICSGVGLYDIHSQIPFYLHSNTNEFLQWTQSISSLVEDLTGCPITRDDTFPQKICSVCISYLKHATQFRRQAINNIKSLRTAREIVGKPFTDEDGSGGFDDAIAAQLSTSVYDKNNVNINNINQVNLEDYEYLKQELDLFFADNCMDDEGDDDDDDGEDDGGGGGGGGGGGVVGDDYDMNYDPSNGQIQQQQLGKAETIKTAIHNFFNYTEKPFEEDDVSNFDRIVINEPADDHKERKCYACKRRFMLNETFNEHMKDCIQAKLFSFITDCHQLAIIKKHKAISAQEFIRRMIFSVKSIVKSLAMCYRVYTKPISVAGGGGGGISLNQSSATLNTQIRPLNNEVLNSNRSKTIPKKLFNNLSNHQTSSNEILKSLPTPKPLNQRRTTVAEQLQTILPPPQHHNERNTAFALFQTTKPSPIIPASLSSSSITTTAATPSTNNEQTLLKTLNFVATCTLCKQKFNSIQSLELHNQQFHNNNHHHQHIPPQRSYHQNNSHHQQPTLMSPGEFTIPSVVTTQSSTAATVTKSTSGTGTSSTSRSDSITDNSSLKSSSSSKLTLLDLLHSDDYGHEGIVDVMKLTKKSPQVINIEARNIHTWKNNDGSSQ